MSHVERSRVHQSRSGPLLSETLPCLLLAQRQEWEGLQPTCIRVGLALFKQLGSSCKLPNTYFERSAWPAAGAFHYFGDISLNMLQFLQPQLRPQSQPQSCLDTRGVLEEYSALD